MELRRYYLLDIARSLAALSILIWHYQFFYFDGSSIQSDFVTADQPLYHYIAVFYEFGWRAVEFFFCLSGFIFFTFFSEQIENGTLSASQMVVDRFSRLYPLHAATMIFVILIQLIYYEKTSQNFGYEHNDVYHFVLNALLIHAWGLAEGFSYNGPSWSISIEVLLYIIFFFVAKRAAAAWIIASGLVVVGGLLVYLGVENVGRGLMCFFAGGIAGIFFLRIRRYQRALTASCAVAISVLAVVWIAAGSWSGAPIYLWEVLLNVLVFPGVILLLASCQERWPGLGRRGAVVGDLTYASYLLHFPVQMTITLISVSFMLEINFDHPITLILYIAFVISVSLLTNWYFERPVQAMIRNMVRVDKHPSAYARLPIYRRRGV